jgi:histidyl-tRNA synthetase
MKLERSRGTRDYLPEEQITRQQIVATLKRVFELYGYPPLDTPALERLEVLTSKYAGGAEILKETFQLTDQGKRKLGLRYDLTVPLARIVGMNPQLKMPFKRYHVGDVWRDGPVGTARYRQFLQCDVDIVGCGSMRAEAEILALTQQAFSEFGMDIRAKLNNIKLLKDILAKFKVRNPEDALLTIDKLAKQGKDAVCKELMQKGLSKQQVEDVLEVLESKGSNTQRLARLRELIGQTDGLSEMTELLGYLSTFNIDADIDFSLARGLTYYTGTIFEVFLPKSKVTSAVAAGGRYDEMIVNFLGSGDYPAVGISFGLDRIFDACKRPEPVKSVTQAYIIPIQTFERSFEIAQQLRQSGIAVDIDLLNRGPTKNLKYANALGIPYVIFIGDEELKQGKVKLRDMQSGKEKLVSVKECVDTISS